jgi:hypothetical protein
MEHTGMQAASLETSRMSALGVHKLDWVVRIGLFLLVCVSAISLTEVPAAGCSVCPSASLTKGITMLGMVTYLIILIISLSPSLRDYVDWLVIITFAGHVFLVSDMVASGADMCVKCVVAGLVSLACVVCVLIRTTRVPALKVISALVAVTVLHLVVGDYHEISSDEGYGECVRRHLEGKSSGVGVILVAIHQSPMVMDYNRTIVPLVRKEFGSMVRIAECEPIGVALREGSVVIGNAKARAVIRAKILDYSAIRGAILEQLRGSR